MVFMKAAKPLSTRLKYILHHTGARLAICSASRSLIIIAISPHAAEANIAHQFSDKLHIPFAGRGFASSTFQSTMAI